MSDGFQAFAHDVTGGRRAILLLGAVGPLLFAWPLWPLMHQYALVHDEQRKPRELRNSLNFW